MSESVPPEQKIIDNLNSIQNDNDNEIFTYPEIKFPELSDNLKLSSLNFHLNEMIKVMKEIENVNKLLYKELTLRPTRFETMGHMLTKYLMRNQPQNKLDDQDYSHTENSQSEPAVKILSKTDQETQQRMLDNMRNNVVQNTELKMNDVKKAVFNVHETLRKFTKDSSLKLQSFDNKINNLHADCHDCIDILKVYLVKEHQLRKRKRLFKSWIFQHQYVKDRNKVLHKILTSTQYKPKKRLFLNLWRHQINQINKMESEQNFDVLKNDIDKCFKLVDSLKERDNDLDNLKMNKTDFDEAKKQMDIDNVKQYCDEIKDLIQNVNEDFHNRTDFIEKNINKDISNLNKKIGYLKK